MYQGSSSEISDHKIKNATKDEDAQVALFLNQSIHTHRHLDWFPVLHWLGKKPCLVEITKGQITALFCAVPENKQAAWMRVFATRNNHDLESTWERLLARVKTQLREMGIHHLATLSLHSWYEKLVVKSGFENRQNIIVLEWQGKLPEAQSNREDLVIRKMQKDDLNEVEKIDHLAFSPLWQNSLPSLEKAFQQPGICTVACINNQIVGYQISNTSTISAHLARLAVHPMVQQQGVGFLLIYRLLDEFAKKGLFRITVNTQSNNEPSLHLYDKFGFKPTSETIPVYELHF
jgi:ribosomal protein S18 acetylase RimI-like enzyme